jgi:lysine-arginine-ornithine-binding protein
MKKTWIVALAMLGAVFSSTSAIADDKMPDPVRIGIEGAYPPFNFIDSSGKVQGFDVDIMNAICAEQKLRCEFVVQDWDGILPGLQAGKYDVVIGVGITEERKKIVDFTGKYWATVCRFVGAKGKDWVYTPEGLKNAVIAVQGGTYPENYVKAELPQSQLKTYQTLDQAFLDMEAGRVDLVFGSNIADLPFLNSEAGKGYEFKGPEYDDPKYFASGVGMAVRKGENKLRDTISEGILKIRDSGQYKQINDKYFPFDVYGQ